MHPIVTHYIAIATLFCGFSSLFLTSSIQAARPTPPATRGSAECDPNHGR